MSWFSGFERIVRADVPLREFTWYKLGGQARWFCEPRDEPELAALFMRIRATSLPWRVLGGGTNIIVRDEGFDGVVIHLRGPVFERTEFEHESVRAGAGADLPKLIRAALKRGLVGLEVLAGVPGTVGGAVRMNAGGRNGEISGFVREVRVLDPKGQIVTRDAAEVGFRYRCTALDDCIVLGVVLALRRGDAVRALARHREIWNDKYAGQPPLAARSAGCVFRNPPGQFAGRLLDEVGLKGARIGGAEISTRHANFIVAYDDATSDDVLNLIRLARERVRQATGIELQPEVEIW
ncbi:MAG: UDP-N-acetylmuramate dehydrogenase [Phycisphaerae bacterium]